MAREKGKPSGINKSGETGITARVSPDEQQANEQVSEKYTKDVSQLTDDIRELHPNRNTDKEKPTNAGGYK
jgi:hypothetical protein